MRKYSNTWTQVIVFSIILCFLLAGCATLQQKWGALTPNEKARIIIGDIQGQLDNLFTTGKDYVATNPKYQDKWKKEIVPAFSVANQSLASVILLGKTKPLAPEFVYTTVQNNVTIIHNLLVQIGAIK